MDMNWYAIELMGRQRAEQLLGDADWARRNGVGRPQTLRSRVSGALIGGGRWLARTGEQLGRTRHEAVRAEQPCR